MNRPLRYGSVCSGIEAASVAWEPLGMTPAWFAEIEPFPSAVLAHRHPGIPNYGDFTKLIGKDHPRASVDVLVGGTPCQAFSIAGLRAGLADPRGNLALAFVALVDALRPRWVVWENVPGVLSSNGGRDFGSFLGALGELGYGWAYRILDAQHFGLAQRRQRVFLVASPGDWTRPAQVLFEPEGVQWDSPPRRQAWSRVAGAVAGRAGSGGGANVCQALSSRIQSERKVFALQGSMIGRSNHAGPCGSGFDVSGVMFTLTKADNHAIAEDRAPVRFLMPHELERLQGFPDHYTAIPYRKKPATECPDGPRAKALGNSFAVPVIQWIGKRILMVDSMDHGKKL